VSENLDGPVGSLENQVASQLAEHHATVSRDADKAPMALEEAAAPCHDGDR